MAELYPAITDEPEFMRLLKMRRGFQAKYIDKASEIYKAKIVDDIASQVIKSIYDMIEQRLAKIREEELNLEIHSVVNDNFIRSKPVMVPITTVTERKNPYNSGEERITYNLEGAEKAYNSGDGRKVYNFGEERIIIYNLGEGRQAKNIRGETKAIDLGEDRKASNIEEEKNDYVLEEEETADNLVEEVKSSLGEEGKTENLGDIEKPDNLEEKKKAGNLEAEGNFGELGDEGKAGNLGEGGNADNLGEEQKADNLGNEKKYYRRTGGKPFNFRVKNKAHYLGKERKANNYAVKPFESNNLNDTKEDIQTKRSGEGFSQLGKAHNSVLSSQSSQLKPSNRKTKRTVVFDLPTTRSKGKQTYEG